MKKEILDCVSNLIITAGVSAVVNTAINNLIPPEAKLVTRASLIGGRIVLSYVISTATYNYLKREITIAVDDYRENVAILREEYGI